MATLLPVHTPGDILPRYRGTPVERLLRYHNLGEPLPPSVGEPQLLVGMCMDHRKGLTIPRGIAYVLRAAGANLRGSEFEISFAVAVGGVDTLVLIVHTDCGMAHVTGKRDEFVRGLVERGGWEPEAASRHFAAFAARHEIGDAVSFAVDEVRRLRAAYPKVLVAPLLYTVEDNLLVQIEEGAAA